MRFAQLGHVEDGRWPQPVPAEEAREAEAKLEAGLEGPKVEWRAVIIADNGDAWVAHGMGWDLLLPLQADMAEEMDEAEFMRTYSHHLTVPDWLLQRLRGQ
jgi:hypothetical protein